MITGTNKGIGFEVARQSGRAGFTILLGARGRARGEKAAAKLQDENFDVRFVLADLNNATVIGAEIAEQVAEEFGHLKRSARLCAWSQGRISPLN